MKSFTLIVILLFSTLVSAHAQKLPNKQEVSVWAPANIKIDGKSTEWNNNFKAYNRNTEVFYTIANNDSMLYLIVKAVDPLVIRKIIAGSITFTVNPSGRTSGQEIALIYPIFDKKNWPVLNLKNKPKVTTDSVESNNRLDSFMYAVNKQLVDKSKEIKILGVKTLDSLISVYNEYGIKASAHFDHEISYTFELAIPLKFLGLSIDNINKFSYNIKLNGSNNVEGVTIIDQSGGGYHMSWSDNNNRPTDMEINFMRFPTDLWGEYPLAKKP